MIFVANKKRSLDRIQKEYPGARIFDITSSAPTIQGQKLSPFYPHGNIPIPGDSKGMTATCVEAIWQGLKVFENTGIDCSMFKNDTMKNIKRTVRKYGKPIGHQYGVFSSTILNYSDAKRLIYAVAYKYVLDNIPSVHSLVTQLAERSKSEDIVLLEPYSTEELKALKRLTQRNKTQKRKIETQEDKLSLIAEMTKLLMTTERSAKEISVLLSIEGGAKTINKYINKVPGLKTRVEKRTKYYTLMEIEQQTLF